MLSKYRVPTMQNRFGKFDAVFYQEIMFLFLVLFTIRQYCIISPQKFSTESFYVFAFGGKGSYLG